MAELDLKDNKGQLPDSSAIKSSGFSNFLSTLFGWRRSKGNTASNKVEFTQVDLGAKEQRVGQAFINNAPNLQGPMSEKLEQLFNIWLTDNTTRYEDLQERMARVSQLEYMVLNDPYVGRTVDLYADESTQLDQQDTLINIETPDARMTKDMYKLLNQWGITQTRVRETIRQLGIYGDAFWANTVTEQGVERIVPLQQVQVSERIEFNPIKALEMKKRREGFFGGFASNNYLIDQMLQSLQDNDSFADLFDTKLFGFNIDNDLTVPAWSVTHFRVGTEGSQFYPFGTSPILGALAPYKQTQSSIALQALAREMNFPITTFEVRTDENTDEASQFALVNRVREEFDNIGVSQKVGNSEVYTVNTKIWIPKDLITVDIKKASDSNTDNVEDIKLYQDRTAVALGIPKSFYGEDGWRSLSQSGKSLIQQYKPFARKCFSLQSAFLEGLADLYRIHFAITGIYDFRIPFTLSMKYPAVEEDSSFIDSKNASIDMANNVIGLVKAAIGAGEDDPLPADIIRDIIGKYTFLDPGDIMKWTRDAKYYVNISPDENTSPMGGGGGGASAGSDIDIDLGGGGESPDEGEGINLGDLGGSDEGGGEDTDITLESRIRRGMTLEARLREYENRPRSKERILKEKVFCEKYKVERDQLYFKILEECAVNNYSARGLHKEVFNTENPHIDVMLEVLNGQKEHERLKEGFKYKKYRRTRSSKKKTQ